MQYVAFCVWLTPSSIMLLRFIPVTFSFLWLNNNRPYVCILSTHSSVDGHLACFHFQAIMNNACMSMYVQVFAWTYVLIILGIQNGIDEC